MLTDIFLFAEWANKDTYKIRSILSVETYETRPQGELAGFAAAPGWELDSSDDSDIGEASAQLDEEGEDDGEEILTDDDEYMPVRYIPDPDNPEEQIERKDCTRCDKVFSSFNKMFVSKNFLFHPPSTFIFQLQVRNKRENKIKKVKKLFCIFQLHYVSDHKGKKEGKYKCTAEWCEKGFPSRFIRDRHSTSCKKKTFACSKATCSARFVYEKSRDAHEKKEHGKFPCDHCKKELTTHKGWEAHVAKCSKNPKNAERVKNREEEKRKKKEGKTGEFYCGHNICGKRFKTEAEAKKHEKKCNTIWK